MAMQQLRSIENNTPASATDVSWNFGTIETFVNNNVVNTDGSRPMIGQLTLPGNPTQDRHAIPKEYADALIPVGMIVDFAGDTAPSGWFLCDGSALIRSEHPQLFAVCGTRFNDPDNPIGETQFRLPNFEDRVSLGVGANTSGSTGGSNDAVVAEHTHTSRVHKHGTQAHGHTINSHSHTSAAHSHTMPSHSHSMNNHYHSDGSLKIDTSEFWPGGQGWLGTGSSGSGGQEYNVSNSPAFYEFSQQINDPQISGSTGGPNSANTASVDPGDTNSRTPGSTGTTGLTTNQSGSNPDTLAKKPGNVTDTGVDGTDLNLPQYVAVHKIIRGDG